LSYQSVYIAFDPHPSSKGASTHITHFFAALQAYKSPAALLTLAHGPEPELAGVGHYVFQSEEGNYLRRGEAFSHWANEFLEQNKTLSLGHFRDIWGGLAVLHHPHLRSVYEVNGLPSIELPYRYPQIAPSTLDKLRELEDYCLHRAETIVTPSETIRAHLQKRGVDPSKITVIPNGAEVAALYPRPEGQSKPYILYQGALQSWQGVEVLLKAFRYLEDFPDLQLVICSGHKPKHARPLQRLVNRMSLTDRVVWHFQLKKPVLQQWMQHAVCTIAPLLECSRNLEQGCSPLKVLESMACGTPVVASDLPVVREILTPNENGLVARAGRPSDLARQIRILLEFPDLRNQLGQAAQKHIAQHYTWNHQIQKLHTVYSTPETEIFES